MDIRRGGLGKGRFAFFDLPTARLIRTTVHNGGPNTTLYIVAVCKADLAIEIIRSKAADSGDEIEDLGRVTGSLVRKLNLASGEFIRVDANYRPQGQLERVESGGKL